MPSPSPSVGPVTGPAGPPSAEGDPTAASVPSLPAQSSVPVPPSVPVQPRRAHGTAGGTPPPLAPRLGRDDLVHALRTPLMNIVGYAEVLADGLYGELSADQRRLLDVILRNARHLEEIAAHVEAG